MDGEPGQEEKMPVLGGRADSAPLAHRPGDSPLGLLPALGPGGRPRRPSQGRHLDARNT